MFSQSNSPCELRPMWDAYNSEGRALLHPCYLTGSNDFLDHGSSYEGEGFASWAGMASIFGGTLDRSDSELLLRDDLHHPLVAP